jgi:CRISPR system Cascade subunit CasE
MYLSRMQLNSQSPLARREAVDFVAMHRRVMQGIPFQGPSPRSSSNTLYRLDWNARAGELWLLVQSGIPPRWDTLPPGYVVGSSIEVKEIGSSYAAITDGMSLAFRLRANPTRKVDTKSRDGLRVNGRRVPVIGGEVGSLAWLAQKGEVGGFVVLDARATLEGMQTSRASRPREGPAAPHLSFASVLFTGYLRATAADALRAALKSGIGPGRAYGFGLLSVAPLRSARE